MTISISPFQEHNYEFILGLNKVNKEVLIPMDDKELRFLCDNAELFDVVYVDDTLAGFIVVLREGIKEYDYKSYKWFGEHYSKFLYIDQVVIDEKYRGQGLGSCLYQKVFEHANKIGAEIVTAAITTDNENSLNFHTKMGFHKVGKQLIRGGTIKISQHIKYMSEVEH